MADLDPYLLRAFLTVVEIGTVNGASASLNRTQAAVSMQIRKLEGLVGVTLFERSTKGLDLTAEGQVLVPFAREIITLNDEIGRRLNGKVIEGRVRFGVVEDFAATRLIEPFTSTSTARHPPAVCLITYASRCGWPEAATICVVTIRSSPAAATPGKISKRSPE